MAMSIKLTYFDIQGVAEKVRLALVLNGIPFEDERISREQWASLKPTAKYGQLPLMTIDGGEPISQSDAMLRYVGRLGDSKLYPRDAASELRIDEVVGLAGDLDRAWLPRLMVSLMPTTLGHPEKFGETSEGQEVIRKVRTDFVENDLPKFLTYFTSILESNGNAFFCGPNPTIADCVILPQLARFRAGFIDHVPTTCLDGFPVIIAWIDRMMAIPEVAAWYRK